MFDSPVDHRVVASYILVSTEDIAETAEFVIVKSTEIVDGVLTVSLEKGIKNTDGDIIRFRKP